MQLILEKTPRMYGHTFASFNKSYKSGSDR